MGTSSTSAQVISLPKGGGALHGIGEKFSPDLFTGTGNFTVPIALPPGRNGFQPQLNLVYSTGSGNGPFGIGWSLSVPGVSRKTSKGVPRYHDAADTFILSGAEDLVPVEETETRTRYQPRTEGLFALIIHHRDAGNDYWEVKSKDGLVSRYGTPHPDNASPDWEDPAIIRDPDPLQPHHIFAWRLTRTTDPFGNRIEYLYDRDPNPADGPHLWDQRYLSEIRYVDHGDPAQPQFLVTVRFIYEDRPDPFSDYRAGFEIRTVRRCTRIEVATHADADLLTRTYHLIYLDQRGLASPELPINGVSLLSRVKVVGHDGSQIEELPPLEFGYTRFEPDKRTFIPVTGPNRPPGSLARPEYELVDLFGNGLPDVLQMSETVRYWRNLGNGRWDLPREMRDAPAGLQLADPGVQLIDANGDGRMDLLVSTDRQNGYYPLQFGGLWDRRSFQRHRMAPSFSLKDPEVRLVDLDGDGVTDAIRSGSRLECFFNDPHEGWKDTRWVERRALEDFPNVNFSDPRVHWADMSGDTLQDIVLVYDRNVEYWPSFGRGDWGKRIHMENSPHFPWGYDPRRILIGDIDGDGLADIVYVEDGKVTLWINGSGNRWSDPIEIHGTPPVSDFDAVRLVDLLGTGVGGVLWTTDANGLSRNTMYFFDFTGGTKPYLLSEMDNHMGSLTRVGYAPSTRFYLEDQQRLENRWKTPLPFPVQVVARVEVIDALSKGKLTTEYSYHHGYWDGAEREFRGFGRVDQRDTELFADYHSTGLHPERGFASVNIGAFSPPTETRTWFHQGPIGEEFGDWYETDFRAEFWPGDPQILTRPPSMTAFLKNLPRRAKRDALRTLRGSILRTELYALDGTNRHNRPYTVTEHSQGVREESPPGKDNQDRLRIFFSHSLAQRTTQWERGDEPMTQFSFTEDYDEHGQPRQQTQIACPRGWRHLDDVPHQPYLATRTVTVYGRADATGPYLFDRVARTTSFEISNTGDNPVLALKDLANDDPLLKVFGQTLHFYDGPAFQGLPFGRIGTYGALTRTENLVLTEAILHEAYKSGDGVLDPAEIPPYLTPSGPPPWTAEYPQEFRDRLPALAGYHFEPGGAGSGYARGYFAASEQRRYDFDDNPAGTGRGLVKIKRDPLGHDTAIGYDGFDLLPEKVTDPMALVTLAANDYRVVHPREITDPNGNRTTYAFSPLGLLQNTSFKGKDGEGDQLRPSTVLNYDFLAYVNTGQPISVRTIRHTHHDTETDVSQPQRDETIETVEYSDGFGRLLQTRTQAEDIVFGDLTFGNQVLPADQSDPGGDAIGHPIIDPTKPRVVVSGWQIYDNKGRVVEKYEPFFSEGWDYDQPTDLQLGQKATMFYDPRGHVIRAMNPDGSEQRVIFGVPPDLTQPDPFTPTPWEAYTYDANDNAGRTHAADPGAQSYAHHWNTPSNVVIDALGRTIETVERNREKRPDGSFTPIEEVHTRSSYDIRGNLLDVTDGLDRRAFHHVYDLLNRPLRIESIDAGLRRTVLDAANNVVEQRNNKGALTLHVHDLLNRPIRLWARDDAQSPVTLRERLVYGDGSDPNQPAAERDANRAANRLGKLYRHYDEAGLLTFETYDFKGNVAEKVRQVIKDDQILSVFGAAAAAPNWQVTAFRVDWQPPTGSTLDSHAATLLDATEYRTLMTYDALNRVKTMRYPQDMGGAHQELHPHYNRAGSLERVALDNTTYVERIAYNAKGQRTLIAYGNRVLTRYAYEPKTFRLARLRTERYTQLSADIYHPTGTVLQDFAYGYDLLGNIWNLQDRTPESGVPTQPDRLNREFTYDALYRLLSATGRECDLSPAFPPWDDQPRCADLTKTRLYTESYQYDPVGNLRQLQHLANGAGFTRNFTLVPNNSAPENNRLKTLAVGGTVYDYSYDPNGNLLQETTSRHFEWDHSDRMRVYRTQTAGSKPSVHAHYLYDATGQRVKKLVRKHGGQVEATVYIDGLFEYHRLTKGGAVQENNTLHIMDNQQRIGLVRMGNPFPMDKSPAVKFHLGDHLGSSNMVVDGAGVLVNREEYTPYAETSFGSFAKKRYRYNSKERDEESGLYYHGARYYAPCIVRWVSCDPARMVDGANCYFYVRNNPITLTDPSGTQAYDSGLDEVISSSRTTRNSEQTIPAPDLPDLLASSVEPLPSSCINFRADRQEMP